MDNEKLTSWDLFVLRHRDRRNLIVHFISFLFYYLSPVVALMTRNPWYMLGFLSSGLIGALGHYVFNDGGVNRKEATASPQVVFYVTIMFYKIIRGEYQNDINRAVAKISRPS